MSKTTDMIFNQDSWCDDSWYKDGNNITTTLGAETVRMIKAGMEMAGIKTTGTTTSTETVYV